MAEKEIIAFYYRGDIEHLVTHRSRKRHRYTRYGGIAPDISYRWGPGYSANTKDGLPEYPWLPRRECYAIALKLHKHAIFVREEK